MVKFKIANFNSYLSLQYYDGCMNIDDFLKNVQIVCICGGLGTRLRHRTGDAIPKALLEIDGRTLLDSNIEMFTKIGCRDFVFLTGHLSDRIEAHLKGAGHDINYKFSIEKEKLGKAGALKFALDNGLIDRKRPCIITYPDDLVVDENFSKKLIERHLSGLEKNCLATVVLVDKTRYRYGVLKMDEEGLITSFEEKPWVQLPTNVAIYVLQPEVYDIINETVDLSKTPVDFEGTVVPVLVSKRLLFSHMIPVESWIPVNEEKELRLAEKMLGKK